MVASVKWNNKKKYIIKYETIVGKLNANKYTEFDDCECFLSTIVTYTRVMKKRKQM